MRVKLEEVCKRIYAGGDVPKDRYSEEKTEKYNIPIYANAEKEDGLYGYTDEAREAELSITVAARGTIGYTAIRREPFLPVVRLITVVPDLSKVSERYLFYALKNCKPQSSGTSIPQLTVPDIKKNTINLLGISEQESIADRLDKLNEIIKLRTEEISKLDELIKARFVEMFGYKGENPKGYDTDNMGNIYKFQYGKGNNIPEDKGEYPCYGSNGVVGHHTEYNSEDAPIIGHIGAYAGIVNWAPGKHYVTYNGVICNLIDSNRINPIYGFHLLQQQDYNKVATKGGGQPFVSYSDLEAPIVVVPPKEIQDNFAIFAEQVDKSKVEVQKALDETKLLFDSLMQEYFG